MTSNAVPINKRKPVVYSGNLGDLTVEGTINIDWDHETEKVCEITGFDVAVELNDNVITFSGESSGFGMAWHYLENVLGCKLEEFAQEFCDYERPTDGDVGEEEYEETLEDFYPRMPRG